MTGGRPQRVRVALDALGGDHAPDVTVAGAVRAAAEGVDVVLVGHRDVLAAPLAGAGAGALPVVHAAEVVSMGEDAALAVRGKRQSSIRVAARLVADGEADALVSAGPTGATLAAALLELGRAPGVRRPAVAAVLPIRVQGEILPSGVVLVDAGASPDAQPDALVTNARLGAAYARLLHGRVPRVGLLNVGTESGKGNELARAAFDLLATTPGFVGNVEPGHVLAGEVDVAVTDGFTGNVFLKTVEAALPGRGAGALLLGVAGPVLVAHGSAGPDEIVGALRMAADVCRAGLVEQVVAGLGEQTGRV